MCAVFCRLRQPSGNGGTGRNRNTGAVCRGERVSLGFGNSQCLSVTDGNGYTGTHGNRRRVYQSAYR